MKLNQFLEWIRSVDFGKKLPTASYIFRPSDWTVIPAELAATVERAMKAADPDSQWNLLKLHTDQVAITFLTYPNFDEDPHPALAEATKINLNTGVVVRTDYRARANPPILHRKETFLPPGDTRSEPFSALTRSEEAEGLYRDTSRIGLRLQWQTLLNRKGIHYEGHRLVRKDIASASATSQVPEAVVERHRTAIKRYDLSKPVKLAMDRGLLQKKQTFFDYGCGHGMDVEALSVLGYTASGWDPAFRPDAPRVEADVVNLGYVLNVIEESAERVIAIRSAFALAKQTLIVSTLVVGQETTAHQRPFRDGFLTKANTFQKFYAPGELEELLESTLDADVITLSFGICVVFKDPDAGELFEASRNRRRIDWSQVSAQLQFSSPSARHRTQVDRYALHSELLDSFWQCLLDLGRAPEPGEFDRLNEVRRVNGGLNKAVTLVVQKNGEQLWSLARKAREEDILVYLAMTNFRKRFLRREIPLRIKNDIKAFFGDLNRAKELARDILFAAGDPGEVELAVEVLDFGVFDREEMQFTFHRSLFNRLPPILRVYVQCGAVRYGNPEEADLIKIHVRSGKLTFLHYDDFEGKPEPVLLTRIKINLRSQFVQVFDHSSEKQPLENKKLFLRNT